MLSRIIVCLDVRGGRVVKGTRFRELRDVGDPVELAERYEAAGADEIVFLDISASAEERATFLDTEMGQGCELLDASDLARRYPEIAPPDGLGARRSASSSP